MLCRFGTRLQQTAIGKKKKRAMGALRDARVRAVLSAR
jgi:hypothetical protein